MKKHVKIIIGIVVVFVLLAAVFIVNYGKRLDEYVEYSVSGSNENGICDVYLDAEAFFEDNIKMTDNKESDFLYQMRMAYDAKEAFDIQIQPSSELKNGDKVTIEIKPDRGLLKKYNIKVKDYKKTFKVENLKDAVVIDVFKSFQPEFTGISPALNFNEQNITIDQDGITGTYNITSTKNSDIANGDVIEFTITSPAPMGSVFKEESFKYTVKNMSQYVLKQEDLTSEEMEQIKQSAIAYISDVNTYTRGIITGCDIYTQSSKDTDSPNQYSYSSLKDIVVENIVFSDPLAYVKGDWAKTLIPFECDTTFEGGSQHHHVYGYVMLENVYHDESGKLLYKMEKMTNLYVDKDDADSVKDSILRGDAVDEKDIYTYSFAN